MKIALGTVQFGLDYGAFNAAGQVSLDDASSILDFAHHNGVRLLDTARAYGESEQVLGQLGAAKRFDIVTKIPSLKMEADKATAITRSVNQSQIALGVNSIATVLFHDENDLIGDDGGSNWKAVCALQERGEIERIGVSVYDGATAKKIAKDFPISVVQLPVSIFDQRSLIDGSLDWLAENGIDVHARSVFLQGFALAAPEKLTDHLKPFAPLLRSFQDCAKNHSISPLAGAVKFVEGLDAVDKIVVGIQSKKELAEIIKTTECSLSTLPAREFACSDPRLIFPANWK